MKKVFLSLTNEYMKLTVNRWICSFLQILGSCRELSTTAYLMRLRASQRNIANNLDFLDITMSNQDVCN